jgi:hypothetical protein
VERLAYALRHYGAVPWEPYSSDVPYSMARRDAIYPANADEVASIFATVSEPVPGIDPPVLVVVQQEDPFIEAPAPLRPPQPKALPNPEEVASIFTAASTTTLHRPGTFKPYHLTSSTQPPAETKSTPHGHEELHHRLANRNTPRQSSLHTLSNNHVPYSGTPCNRNREA